MKKYLKYICLALLTLLPFKAYGQYSYYGDESLGIKWESINSDNFSIIYPQGLDTLAVRYLTLFESVREESLNTLNIKPLNIPIVLHPYSITNQSKISWAPKRIDISTTPYGNEFTLKWDLLQSVKQSRLGGIMTYFTQGDYVPFKYLFGEQSVALGVGFSPSSSAYKGDAMLLMSDWFDGGPATSAKVSRYYRAAFLNGDIRTLDKWKYGSYKHYTPKDDYRGFMLDGTMRRYSGNLDYMGDITEYVTDHWWHFFSRWNVAYQSSVGKTMRKTWRQIFTPAITDLWLESEKSRGSFTPYTDLIERDKRYVEYKDYQIIDDKLFAFREGMSYSKQFVELKDGKVKYIRPFSSQISSVIKIDNVLYWTEVVSDIRWNAKQYSIVRSYDPSTGKFSSITSKTRYFNPKACDNGNIMVVEYSLGGLSSIVVVNLNGEEIFRKSFDEDIEIREAILFNNRIYFTAASLEGFGLYSTTYDDVKEYRTEICPQSQIIEKMGIADYDNQGKQIVFVSDYDDVENLYCYNPFTGQIVKKINSRFGITSKSVFDGNLIYSEYDNLGYHPVITPLDKLENQAVDFSIPQRHVVKEFFDQTAEPVDSTYRHKSDAESITTVPEALFSPKMPDYTTNPYKRFANSLHIHSWAPLYVSVDRISDMSYDHYYQLAAPGATVLLQNVLGTFTAQIGYSAHKERYFFEPSDNGIKNDKWFHSGHIYMQYSGLYPVIEMSLDFNDRYSNTIFVSSDYYGNPVLDVIPTQKPAIEYSLSSYIPFDFSKGGWNRGLIPYINGSITNDYYAYSQDSKYLNCQFSAKAGVRYYSVTEVPKSRLFPRSGFGIDAFYKISKGIRDVYGSKFHLYSYGYIPGLTPEQGLKLKATLQYVPKSEHNLYDWNDAAVPRGYKGMHFGNYASFSADYAIPLWLGDVTWPWLYYLMRLQLVPFFDFAINDTPGVAILKDSKFYQKNRMYSFGVDSLIDSHLFRIGSKLSFGVRYARTAEGENYFGLLLRTGLNE